MENKSELYNIEAARGYTIERLFEIELRVNQMISEYFDSKNSEAFNSIILNSSILDFGKKIKVLLALKIIDHKTADKLRKISSIRNSFAHAGIETRHELPVDSIEDNIQSNQKIKILKSNGDLEESNISELLKSFVKLYNEIQNKLRQNYS